MFRIRRYRSSDYPDIWELHNPGLQVMGAHLGNGPWDEDLHQIERHYFDDGAEFLVGLLETEIVAMGAFRILAAGHVEMKRLRVHPRYWRRGSDRRCL